MDHEQFTEPDGDGVHRALGAALTDVTLDGDVVPAVLAGYERHVRTRRWQVVGGTLAVLAVAAAGVEVLPDGGAGRTAVAPAIGGAMAPNGGTLPPGEFRNVGCHRQWTASQVDYDYGLPPLVPTGDPDREQAFCEALTDAVLAGVPGATFISQPSRPNIVRDSRLDQAKLAEFTLMRDDATHEDPHWTVPPAWHEFTRELAAETARVILDPSDPANDAQPNIYTLTTGSGAATFTLQFGDPSSVAKPVGPPVTTDCAAPVGTDLPGGSCTPVAVGGWHGAVRASSGQPGTDYVLEATLTDGKGHYVMLWSTGAEDPIWRSNPDPADATGTTQWTNIRTGKTVPGGVTPPLTPALTAAQLTVLVSGPKFGTLLDQALPTYAGWKS